MSHDAAPVQCLGPDSPHAFDVIPLQPRRGELDALCPTCQGHGQWNTKISLKTFRSKRAICALCDGAGWVETGDDLIAVPDIVCPPGGAPMWITRYVREVS